MKKRIICLALVAVMIFTLLPMSAFAADVVANGTCGENLTWTLDSEGTLTISGTGAMTNYTYNSGSTNAPWYNSRSSIKSVIIENGVTSIGSGAFSGCSGLTSITIPERVTSIGSGAFYNCSGLTSITIPERVTSIGSSAFSGCSGLTSVTIGNGVTSIGNSAFSSCGSLQSVTIPDSVTSIGKSAFSNCGSLQSVTIPDSVTSIGSYAFSGCSGLTSITIPESVTSIGSSAFYNCSGLTSVTIGNGVTSIGFDMFYNCSGLTSITIPESVTSIGSSAFYNCSGLTSITIPESVTSIDSDAFYNCSGLTEINYNAKAVADLTSSSDVFSNAGTAGSGIKVTFGDGVEKIPAYLFYVRDSSDTPKVTSVTIGNGVTSIGSYAFYNCSGLTEINYNAKAVADLTSDSYVFYRAGTAGSGIKVTFGEKVKKIPNYLFSTFYYDDSPKISEIIFLGNAPAIGSSSFNRVTAVAYYPYGNDTWISGVLKNYGGKITWVPYSDAEATSVVCNGKTSYIVGDELDASSISVTIERSDGCVEKYNYASGEITLGEYDMSKSGKQSIAVTCKDVTTQLNIFVHILTSETMPSNDYPESSHNYEDNLDKTYTYTADGAYSLDVTFSSDTETEANIDYIYVNGTQYTGKELANKTVHINGDTLTVRLVSDGSDGAYGFSIDSIVANYLVHEYTDTVVAPTCTEKGYTTHTCVCGDSHVDSYVDALGHDFGEWTVTTAPTCTEKGVETRYCSRCDATETREVDALGHNYESGKCTQCGAIEIINSGTCGYYGDNLKWTLDSMGVLTISGEGKMAQYNSFAPQYAPWYDIRANIKEVVILDNVTDIGDCAFYDCKTLLKVSLPDSITKIGSNVFYECSSLTSVNIPSSVNSIGGYAFGLCSSLETVTIENGVTSIGVYAFYSCSSLTNVALPNSVSSIGKLAFQACSKLTNINLPDGIKTIEYGTFSGCSALTSVNIPNSVYTIGEFAFYNCSKLDGITIPDGVAYIDDYAFKGCSSLTSITIPDSVVSLGNEVFRQCSALNSVQFGNGITSIGSSAFYGCTRLTGVVLPNSVSSIGNSAFQACSKLTNINLPDGIKTIEDRTFSGCSALTSVNIPNSVSTIGESAFYNCAKLDGITIPDGVTNIKDKAFYGCRSLTSITIPDSVVSLGNEVFRQCSSLNSVQFGNGITSIGNYLLANCGEIKNIVIPKSVTTIDANAFYYCEVGEIAYGGTKQEWDEAFVDGTLFAIGYVHFNCTSLDNHWKTSKIIKPGCFDQGYTEFACDCGYSYCDNYVPAFGSHDLVHHDGKAATCTEKGWEAYDTCSRCDYTTYKEIPATGHNYTSSVTAPTCTEKGYTTYTCSCGDSYVADYVDALGHDFSEWTETTAPTCTEKGVETRHCSRCDATETRDVDALGHDFGAWKQTKAPTCTEKGTETRTCTRCNAFEIRDVTPTGHHYTAAVTAPTCTTQGYTTHTCTCGDSYVDSYTNALCHDFGAWTETTAPTCTEKGVETRYCSRCDATETREVDALGHALVHHDGKAATCTEKGCEAYDTCSRCDYTTYKEIPATGHIYTSSVTAPTCTGKGYTTHTCSCGDSYKDSYVNALGHNYKNGACTRCGAKDPNFVKNPFVDVKEKDYFYEPVLWAVENGITNGTSKTTFSPDATCTRAQTVTFLWRAMGSPEVSGVKNPFVDVKPSDYYYKAVLWAVKNGVTQGIDATHFGPNNTVTRGQTVTFMWRAAGSPAVSGVKNPFVDVKPSDYYCKAVLWAVENGITNGMSATTFAPNAGCTRGQIVTFLYRHLEK